MKMIMTTDNGMIKSAVAFFFLFFLNGTSIGNGQQGITHNGRRIREGYEAEPLAWGSFLLYAVITSAFNEFNLK